MGINGVSFLEILPAGALLAAIMIQRWGFCAGCANYRKSGFYRDRLDRVLLDYGAGVERPANYRLFFRAKFHSA